MYSASTDGGTRPLGSDPDTVAKNLSEFQDNMAALDSMVLNTKSMLSESNAMQVANKAFQENLERRVIASESDERDIEVIIDDGQVSDFGKAGGEPTEPGADRIQDEVGKRAEAGGIQEVIADLRESLEKPPEIPDVITENKKIAELEKKVQELADIIEDLTENQTAYAEGLTADAPNMYIGDRNLGGGANQIEYPASTWTNGGSSGISFNIVTEVYYNTSTHKLQYKKRACEIKEGVVYIGVNAATYTDITTAVECP